jgi:hypothetical protein
MLINTHTYTAYARQISLIEELKTISASPKSRWPLTFPQLLERDEIGDCPDTPHVSSTDYRVLQWHRFSGNRGLYPLVAASAPKPPTSNRRLPMLNTLHLHHDESDFWILFISTNSSWIRVGTG